MKKFIRLSVISAVILAMAIGFTACGGKDSGENTDGGTVSFGEFETQLLGGGTADESIFEDHDLTMVNVWTTFCGYCIDEMPDLQQLSMDYMNDGLQVIGIVSNANDPQNPDALQITEHAGATYPQLLASPELIDRILSKIQGVPASFFVNSEGEVVSELYMGYKSYDQLVQMAEENLAAEQDRK